MIANGGKEREPLTYFDSVEVISNTYMNETDIRLMIHFADVHGIDAKPEMMLRIRTKYAPAPLVKRCKNEDDITLDLDPRDFEIIHEMLGVAIERAKERGIIPRGEGQQRIRV